MPNTTKMPSQVEEMPAPPQQPTEAPHEEDRDIKQFELDFKRLHASVDACCGEIEFDSTFLVDKRPDLYQKLLLARANISAANKEMIEIWNALTTG